VARLALKEAAENLDAVANYCEENFKEGNDHDYLDMDGPLPADQAYGGDSICETADYCIKSLQVRKKMSFNKGANFLVRGIQCGHISVCLGCQVVLIVG